MENEMTFESRKHVIPIPRTLEYDSQGLGKVLE